MWPGGTLGHMPDEISDAENSAAVARALEHLAWRLRGEDEDAQRLKLAMQGIAISLGSSTEHPSSDQLAAIVEILKAEFKRISPSDS